MITEKEIEFLHETMKKLTDTIYETHGHGILITYSIRREETDNHSEFITGHCFKNMNHPELALANLFISSSLAILGNQNNLPPNL